MLNSYLRGGFTSVTIEAKKLTFFNFGKEVRIIYPSLVKQVPDLKQLCASIYVVKL